MNNAKTFGRVLSAIRREQGYASAHQFFKSVGGSKILGLAFVSYWDMERGKKLPKSWRLKAILSALGVEQNSSKAKELVRAYFKALSGSDELVQILAGQAVPGAPRPARGLAEAAVEQDQVRRSVNLTLEQWKILAADMETEICHDFLLDTPGGSTVPELAGMTGFKPEAVRKAFKALVSAGLITVSGGKARSRLTGKVVNTIPKLPETVKITAALRGHMDAWLESAKVVDRKVMSLRMTKASMEEYRRHLETAINLASVYRAPDTDKEESKVYYIRGEIFGSPKT